MPICLPSFVGVAQPASGGAFPNEYSLNFDGSDDTLDVASTSDFAFGTSGFSIGFWFKPEGTNNSSGFGVNIFDMRGGVVNIAKPSLWMSSVGAGSIFKYYAIGYKPPSGATATINPGTWYHLLITNDGSNTRLYLDGNTTPISTGSDTNNYLAAPLRIGGYSGNDYYYNGLIDEFAIWDATLSGDDANAIYNDGVPNDLDSAASYDTDRTSNLIGWWRMGDGGTWDGSNWTIPDASTNSNTGTTANMAEASRVTTVPEYVFNRYSLSLDGSDDYLLMGTSAISLDTNFTISAWFKPNSAALAGYDFIGGWGNNLSGQARVMQILHSKLSFEIYIARVSGATTLSADTWYHGAVTFSGDNVEIFLNGSSDGTGTISRNPMSSSLTFAGGTPAMTSDGFAPFSGLIDEFAVFDSVLSSTDISTLRGGASAGTLGAPVDISSLNPVGWWRMGENDSGTGTTITDQGSGGNDGSLTNIASPNGIVADVP